ncbi:uncharacterized protein KQ657_001306 [Scheffersomyces spartinae]|uniref:Uncharacterized protein n=1 Tax=Scheffersomyces spartinae TaxID=45513 RepID=A0A9P7V7L0_9ASCO|nr:uncharacterized protein KQ657_001306 [Scheffersomyces spartinae]KAG7192849.1 hypothetical protein KQ657_001306 [Scheffersomyces spartinae]
MSLRLVPKNPDNGLQLIVDFKSTGLIGRNDDEEIIKRYLKTNHAYFDDGNNGNTYLEILSIKLLEAILPDFDSPLTSPLVLSFVSSLLGDLVLQKTLDVLSSPEFLIKQIYTQVLPRIKNRTKETALFISIKDRAKQMCLKLYNVIMASSSTTPSSIDLLRLQAFALVDLVTEFSTRQPLLASSLLFCRGIVELGTFTQQKVNAILISYLRGLVETLDIPGLSCTIMSALGEAIFNFRKENKGNEPMEDSPSFSEMMDSIAETFAKLAPSSFYYQEETSTDLNEFFRNRLQLLTYPELNKLVVLELLDMILGVLYPEITVK